MLVGMSLRFQVGRESHSYKGFLFGSNFLPFSFHFFFHVHNGQGSPGLLMLGFIHVVIAHTDQFHVILRTISWYLSVVSLTPMKVVMDYFHEPLR